MLLMLLDQEDNTSISHRGSDLVVVSKEDGETIQVGMYYILKASIFLDVLHTKSIAIFISCLYNVRVFWQ